MKNPPWGQREREGNVANYQRNDSCDWIRFLVPFSVLNFFFTSRYAVYILSVITGFNYRYRFALNHLAWHPFWLCIGCIIDRHFLSDYWNFDWILKDFNVAQVQYCSSQVIMFHEKYTKVWKSKCFFFVLLFFFCSGMALIRGYEIQTTTTTTTKGTY